jgi:hypothetical protein
MTFERLAYQRPARGRRLAAPRPAVTRAGTGELRWA